MRKRNLIVAAAMIFIAAVRIPAAEPVLVIQTRDDYLAKVTAALESELSGAFTVVKPRMVRDTNEIAAIIANVSPKVIVVLEKRRKSASLYPFREYIQPRASGLSNVAFIFVNEYFMDRTEIYMNNATGIAYQPPIVLGVEKLQASLGTEVRSVGIIHRFHMRKMLMENSQSCVLKGISLMMKAVPDTNEPAFSDNITEALNKLKKQKADALWIVEDERLLQFNVVRDVWEPFLNKSRIPTIVNNPSLMADPTKIGTVCIVPDPGAVGGQIAKKVRELKRGNWIVTSPSIEPLDEYSDYQKKKPLSRSIVSSALQKRAIQTHASVAEPKRVANAPERAEKPAPAPSAVPPVSPELPPSADPDTALPVSPEPSLASAIAPKTDSETESPKEPQPASPSAKTGVVDERKSSLRDDRKTKAGRDAKNDFSHETEKIIPPPPLPPEQIQKVIKYVLVITNQAPIRKLPDTASIIIGRALSGQQFAVFEERGAALQIAFFNTTGWMDAADTKVIESLPTSPVDNAVSALKKYIVPIIFCALGLLVVVLLIILIVVYSLASRSAKQTLKKGCMLLTKKTYQREREPSLKVLLMRLGFKVHVVTNLKLVKKWINDEHLDFIFVDWLFDTHIEEKLGRVLRGSFRESTVHIVFFGVAKSVTLAGKQVIRNAVYLGTDFTTQDIYRIVAPRVLSGGSEMGNNGMKGHLEGDVAGGSIAEILEFIDIGKKSGCLMINIGKPCGMIYFHQGIIIHAATTNVKGMDAVFAILGLKQGNFRFVADLMPRERNLSVSAFEALMMWAKETDESSVAAGSRETSTPQNPGPIKR